MSTKHPFTDKDRATLLQCIAEGKTGNEAALLMPHHPASAIRQHARAIGHPFPRRSRGNGLSERERAAIRELLQRGRATIKDAVQILPDRQPREIYRFTSRVRREEGGHTLDRKASDFWIEHGDRAVELMDEGLSYRKIGEQLGVTKNSVIGFFHRNGLDARPTESLSLETRLRAHLLLTDRECHWPVGDPDDEGFHYCGGKAHHADKRHYPYCIDHCRQAYVDFEGENPEERAARLQEMRDAVASALKEAEAERMAR